MNCEVNFHVRHDINNKGSGIVNRLYNKIIQTDFLNLTLILYLTIVFLAGKGIHLPSDFTHETFIDKPLPDNPNRIRDTRRTILGFFAEQKTLVIGASQKQSRSEMLPEYRTSQSVYSAKYTGYQVSMTRLRTPSSSGPDPNFVQGQFARQTSLPGVQHMVPSSPHQSESGSSHHSASPMYDPSDSPRQASIDPRLSSVDPRLAAHASKRLAVSFTSKSQVDPRLAKTMGSKAPVQHAQSAVPPLILKPTGRTDRKGVTPPVRSDPRTSSQQVPSASPSPETAARYAQLQASALEYAKYRSNEKQKQQQPQKGKYILQIVT